MPNPVTTPRQLDWNEIEQLRQARDLLASHTKVVRDVYWLDGQQLIDVKLWLEEHMNDYPQWVVLVGSGFVRDFQRDATAEEIAEATTTVEQLSPLEMARRSTTFGDRLDAMAATPIPRNTGETIRWRRLGAINTSSEPSPLTTPTGTVSSPSTNTTPSSGFWLVDELSEVDTSHVVMGSTPTMLMFDVETQALPNVHSY